MDRSNAKLTIVLALLVLSAALHWLNAERNPRRINALRPSGLIQPTERGSSNSLSEVKTPKAEPSKASEQRAPKPAGTETQPALAQTPLQEASLRIHVVERATQKSVPGARLICREEGSDPTRPLDYIEYSSGDTSLGLLSDPLGEALFYVKPESRLSLFVFSPSEENMQSTHVEVAALRSGEHRKIQVELSAGDDLAFFGQLVREESGEGMFGLVRLYQGGQLRSSIGVDEQGRFEFTTDSWRASHIEVQAPDMAPLFVPLEPPYGSKEDPQRIVLSPSAQLEAHITTKGGDPAPNIRVRLTLPHASFLPKEFPRAEESLLEFEGRTDASGLAHLRGLPTGVPMHVRLEPDDIPQAHGELTLKSGGNKRRYTLLETDVVNGRLVDHEGQPIAMKELWIQGARTKRPLYWSCGSLTKSFFTDAAGRFSVPVLYQGSYVIGPCDACPPLLGVRSATGNRQQVAPLAYPVILRADAKEILLQLDTRLYIEGQVYLSEDRPYPRPQMEVIAEDFDASPPWTSKNDGTFRIGPLQRGKYRIRAHSGELESLASDWMTVRAAHRQVIQDLELQLQPRVARIQGTVRNHAGQPVSASVFLDPAPSDAQLIWEQEHLLPAQRKTISDFQTGQFEFAPIKPGRHRLLAFGTGGFAQAEIFLPSERSATHGADLVLSPIIALPINIEEPDAQSGPYLFTIQTGWQGVLADYRFHAVHHSPRSAKRPHDHRTQCEGPNSIRVDLCRRNRSRAEPSLRVLRQTTLTQSGMTGSHVDLGKPRSIRSSGGQRTRGKPRRQEPQGKSQGSSRKPHLGPNRASLQKSNSPNRPHP